MFKPPLCCLALLALLASAHAARPPAHPATKAALGKTAGPRPEVVAFWHLERDVKAEGRGAGLGAARRVDGAEFFFTEEVPGPFIYDPLQKLSYPNNTSLNFQSGADHNDALEIAFDAAKAGLVGQSVTLELFFKPDAEWAGPVAMKSRLNDSATEWGLEARYFEQQHQTYLHAFFTPPGGQTEHFRGGHYGSSAQIRSDNTDWRHLAFVYDATAKSLTCYIDYYQVKTVAMPGEMKWDAGAFYIGGGPGQSRFDGRVDEVRLTKGALRPSQFLRARRDPIAGVSFESVETLLPRDCGFVDLKESFGAMGDGRTDDTPALREAFRALSNQGPLGHDTLYIPPGTYLVSESLVSGRSLTVQGAGSDKTIIKLRDKCPGFLRATEGRAVWQVDSAGVPPLPKGTGGEGLPGAAIYNLAIDTGKGNVGAKGLEVQAENLRHLEEVQIRSDDGTGLVGLEFGAKARGPALVKNVRIKGFDCGVIASAPEATATFEQLGLEGQRVTGIKDNGQILAIRQLNSVNKVPALISFGAASMVTILDSSLKGGDKDGTAMQSEGGLYALRVETAGYKTALRKRALVDDKTKEWKEQTVVGPKLDEFIGDQLIAGHGALTGALKLPIENTPDVPWGDIHKDWVNVQLFADKKNGEDWGPAIQAAIDSGAHTVYLPSGRYEILTPVHIRGKLDRLFGLRSQIVRASGLAADEPVLIFDQPDAKRTVVLERLEIDALRHTSPATLVLKSTNPRRYDNAAGCGKLFLEDVGTTDFHFNQAQSVWARQWSLGPHGDSFGITSHGANLWCLGFSSEDASNTFSAEAGARTELLGAFLPASSDSTTPPLFSNTDSRLSLVYGTGASDSIHDLQIVDTKGSETKEVRAPQLKWVGTRARMDLFSSDASLPAH